MTNYEIRMITKEIDILSLEICDNYETCEECPFNIRYSTIKQNNGTEFASSCVSIIMQRVIETNLPKEG